MLTKTLINETIEATDGQAVMQASFIFDDEQAFHRITLNGFIQISPHGVKNEDLLAARNALEEILIIIRDKYPYVEPPP